MDWIEEACRVRAMYADGDVASAHVAEAGLLRRFARAVAAGEIGDPREVAGLLERELLAHDRLELAIGHRVAEAEPWRNEVQIRGGPRDGELVPYVGQTMRDGADRYVYRRVRSESGGSSHHYVPV